MEMINVINNEKITEDDEKITEDNEKINKNDEKNNNWILIKKN